MWCRASERSSGGEVYELVRPTQLRGANTDIDDRKIERLTLCKLLEQAGTTIAPR